MTTEYIFLAAAFLLLVINVVLFVRLVSKLRNGTVSIHIEVPSSIRRLGQDAAYDCVCIEGKMRAFTDKPLSTAREIWLREKSKGYFPIETHFLD